MWCVSGRKRAPYIAYLTRCRQGLQTSQAHLEKLLQRVLRDKEVANRYFTTVCVRLLLEHMESRMQDFIRGVYKSLYVFCIMHRCGKSWSQSHLSSKYFLLQHFRASQQLMIRLQQWRISCVTYMVRWHMMWFGSMPARNSCRMPKWLLSGVLWIAFSNWHSTQTKTETFSETSEKTLMFLCQHK